MQPIIVDVSAFCASAVKAPMHPWGIQSGMQFKSLPPPDQSSSTARPPWSGTVVSASRVNGIVLQSPDSVQVRISDEQLRSVDYSCPHGSDSRDTQWGSQVVKLSCQAKLPMQSVRSPVDYINDLIAVNINPDDITDADVLKKNSLQELRKSPHPRTSSAG
jgi:hypothetical protein